MAADSPMAKLRGFRVPAEISANVMVHEREAVVLFDNLTVCPDSSDQTHFQTKTVTFQVQYLTEQPSVPMTLQISGSAARARGIVRLVACAGDAAQAVNMASWDGNTGVFDDAIAFTVQKDADELAFHITLLLVAEGNASLTVNSLSLVLGCLDPLPAKDK